MWATLVAEAYDVSYQGEVAEEVRGREAEGVTSGSCQEDVMLLQSKAPARCLPQVVGYVIISLRQPLALLPPPFPTYSPLCLHVDALAVSPNMRRRGVARALHSSAERLGKWQQQEGTLTLIFL
jgi:ribosomal protein S18 acetylase RimI-like enzyme